MKIVHVMGMRSQKFGGLERFMAELARQLNVGGNSLTLIYEELPANKDYISTLNKAGVNLIVCPCRGSKLFRFIPFFISFLVKNKPDVVHVHFDPSGYVSLGLARAFGVKRRFKTMHSMLGIGHMELSLKTKLLKRLMVAWSTKIFAVSDAIRKEFESTIACHNKQETQYLGVSSFNTFDTNLLKEKYVIPKNKVIITCVAFHGHIKGVDILLNALRHLVYELGFTDFICLQVGGGNNEYGNYLKSLAEDLAVSDYISWMGLQDNVPEILALSDICVQPSRSEGIPLTLMEASMQETPIIAMNVGGIPEVVSNGKNGFLIETENHEQLAEKLSKLCTNKELRIELGRAARDMAIDKFDLTSNVTKLINQYN